MEHIDAAEFFKIVGVATSVCSILGGAGMFVIRSLIRHNNERLLERFNHTYLRRELYEAKTSSLIQRLDTIHAFQKDRQSQETERFNEVADICQDVKSTQETQNIRLAVIESKLGEKDHRR